MSAAEILPIVYVGHFSHVEICWRQLAAIEYKEKTARVLRTCLGTCHERGDNSTVTHERKTGVRFPAKELSTERPRANVSLRKVKYVTANFSQRRILRPKFSMTPESAHDRGISGSEHDRE